MKRFIVSILIVCCTAILAMAQDKKDIATTSFKVEGNCEMCKKRIEDAAYAKGVKRAEWNETTHTITVIYRPSKTNPDEIMQHIAHAGHNTDKYKATEAEYKKLPDCCQYQTNTCNHK